TVEDLVSCFLRQHSTRLSRVAIRQNNWRVEMTEGQQSDDQEPQQKEPLQLGGDNAPVTGLETMNTQTVPPAESKEDDQESESGDAAAGAAKGESSKKLENKSLHSSIHDSQVQVAFTGSNIGTLIVQQGGGHES